MDSKLWILLNPVTDQVQKHSETALDTLKKIGYREQFSYKNALDRPTQGMAVREIPWFYGRSRKNGRPIRKIAGFTDDLKKPVLIAPLRGANVVQNPKEKSQILENQRFAI